MERNRAVSVGWKACLSLLICDSKSDKPVNDLNLSLLRTPGQYRTSPLLKIGEDMLLWRFALISIMFVIASHLIVGFAPWASNFWFTMWAIVTAALYEHYRVFQSKK